MNINIIAAVASNGVIGNRGALPWYIPEDLKRFKQFTLGKTVIMGRKTYEAIINRIGKTLPERISIVLTRQNLEPKENVIFCSSIDEAIEKAKAINKDCYVIGGQVIFESIMDKADRLEITHIHKDYDGDVYFPEIKKEEWREVMKEDKESDNAKYTFTRYERIKPKKGLFIAFEGVDGSGKSTQLKNFISYLFNKDKHYNIIVTRNPYKDMNIRAILREDDDPYQQAEKLVELFINDRKRQTAEIIKPNLENNNIIISDRYKLSTITYQACQGLDMQELINKHKTSEFVVPDITFIVDVSAEVASERMKKEDVSIRGKEHKFEANLDFARKLRDNYFKAKELLEKDGEKVFIINGERPIGEIFEDIKRIFEENCQ